MTHSPEPPEGLPEPPPRPLGDAAGDAAPGDGDRADSDQPGQPWLEGHELGGQLHPSVIGVWSTAQLGALVLVAIIRPESILVLLPVAAVMVAVNAVRWSRFRWEVGDHALVITQGVLQRHRRVIPLERIQSVDIVRRVSHRLFRVEALHVEAIGGNDTEGQLDALTPAVARRVRAALLAGRDAARRGEDPRDEVDRVGRAPRDATAAAAPTQAAGDDGEELARVSPKQLVYAGVTEANVTVLAAATGFGWQFLSERIEEVAQRLPAIITGPWVAVATIAGVLVVAVLLLVLGQFLTYWNFRLTRTAQEMRVRRGLLEQRFDTVPLRRLQAIRIEENVPRRLLGYAAVKADVAGKPGGGSTGTDTLLPFGTSQQARELVEEILAEPGAAHVELTPMPVRAKRRRQVRALAATAVATAAAVAVWGLPGLAAGLVAVPALAAGHAAYRALGWARPDGLLIARAGWWTRRTAFVPEHRLQAAARTATVLQRWRGLATVELQIARSPGLWSGPRWIDLDSGDADRQMLDLSGIMIRMPASGMPTPTGHDRSTGPAVAGAGSGAPSS